jgi:hypothetical protein
LLATWTAEAEEVNERWVSRARRLYKSAPPAPRRRRADLALDRERLWIGQSLSAIEEAGPDAEAAGSQILDETSNAVVSWWQMEQSEADLMQIGDTVVLANVRAGSEPHGRAKAGPPGKVMALVAATGPFRASAILAHKNTWPHSTYARVRETANAIQWSFDEPITNREVIDSILSLFDL